MEYRRKYLRRFGNQNHGEKPKENIEQNQKEEKIEPSKEGKKVNTQSIYLQKLLQRTNNVQNPTSISITSVKDSLPSFKNNIHDILSTDENKQKAIKYVIQKRNSGKKGNFQINTENEQEESNPVLANRYSYHNKNNNFNNNSNVGAVYNKSTNVNVKKEEKQQDIKSNLPNYYSRRTKPIDTNKEREQFGNYNENPYRGRKIQISVSTNNMLKSPKNTQQFEKDEKIVVKKERNYNINSYRNNNANDIKETEEQKPRYRYLRGYVKRFDAEQKEKEANKEKEPEIENKNTQPKEINLNLSVGKNFSFGIKDIMNNKSFGNQSSNEITYSEDNNKFKGYKSFKIVKTNFIIGQKNKKDVYTKKYVISRQKDKPSDNKKDLVKDKIIEIKFLGNKNINNYTNTEASVSRFRRKYGKYSSNVDEQNLSFKDENELISYLAKKYNQEKIIELFKIKLQEEQKSKKEELISKGVTPDIKQLMEQLSEEKRKNEEKENKLKKLETNISEQTNEIRDKNIGIGKKIQEIDKLKNDITSFKKELQSKEKENAKLKYELEQLIKAEGNKQNKLKEELDKIKINYDTLIKENEKNLKNYNEILTENDKNKKDYEDLLKDFETLQQNNAKLAEIKKSKEELDINFNSTKEENSKLKEELDKLKNNFNINKEELNKYKTENEKIKGEMDIMNNLNDKLIEDNSKQKEDIQNINNDLEKNKQQIIELSKTKDKYYKLLDDYKQLTRDCNILRDEKTSIQIGQKQILSDKKNLQDENEKLKEDLEKIKNDYDILLKELNNNQQIPKSILKNKDNSILNNEKIDNDIKFDENSNVKSLIQEKAKIISIDLNEMQNKEESNETQKITDISNVILDVNNNLNDIINKINNSNPSSAKKEEKESSVKFNIKEEKNNEEEPEKKKLDEEKNNIRLSKAMQRIKKKQENNENNSQLKINKSLKVQDLVKELENNMQKRDIIEGGKEEMNGGAEIQIENGANVVNVLENQQITKSMKKKKKVKTFEDDEK